MVGSAIESILSSVNATIVGGAIPDRRGAQWVVYTMISIVPHNSKDGASTYDKYRFQFDIYERTYAAMDTLAASVKSTLDEYEGTAASVVIDHIFFESEFDTTEFIVGGVSGPGSAPGDRSKEFYYRRSQDYIIFVRP